MKTNLIKIESQIDWNYGALKIADGVRIGNRRLYYTHLMYYHRPDCQLSHADIFFINLGTTQ